MRMLTITVTERIQVPDDAEINIAPSGMASGIRLADGRIVKPWICYELETQIDGEDEHHDMDPDELSSIGFETNIEMERTIEES